MCYVVRNKNRTLLTFRNNTFLNSSITSHIYITLNCFVFSVTIVVGTVTMKNLRGFTIVRILVYLLAIILVVNASCRDSHIHCSYWQKIGVTCYKSADLAVECVVVESPVPVVALESVLTPTSLVVIGNEKSSLYVCVLQTELWQVR